MIMERGRARPSESCFRILLLRPNKSLAVLSLKLFTIVITLVGDSGAKNRVWLLCMIFEVMCVGSAPDLWRLVEIVSDILAKNVLSSFGESVVCMLVLSLILESLIMFQITFGLLGLFSILLVKNLIFAWFILDLYKCFCCFITCVRLTFGFCLSKVVSKFRESLCALSSLLNQFLFLLLQWYVFDFRGKLLSNILRKMSRNTLKVESISGWSRSDAQSMFFRVVTHNATFSVQKGLKTFTDVRLLVMSFFYICKC